MISNISRAIAAIFWLICLFIPAVTNAGEHQVIEKARVMPSVLNTRGSRQVIYIRASQAAPVSIDVLDAEGKYKGTVRQNILIKQGDNMIAWQGKINGVMLQDGAYSLRLSSGLNEMNLSFKVQLKRKPSIQYSTVWPKYFTPNGSGPRRMQGIYFSLNNDGFTTVQVLYHKKVVRTISKEKRNSGTVHELWWDGKNGQGEILTPGPYTIRIKASNSVGRSIKYLPFRIHKTNYWRSDADHILGQLTKAYGNGDITTQQYRDYRETVVSAKMLLENLKNQQRIQEWIDLGYVLHQVKNRKAKISNQHYFLFDILLKTNLTYFARNSSPAGWTPFKDLDDTFSFVYYQNRGIQPHPVATMVKINKMQDDTQFLRSLDKLINNLDRRYSASKLPFEQLLYHMEFQGGPSFWPSAMSQAKLLAALGRASNITQDPRYGIKARLVMNSFYVSYKEGGVLDAPRTGNWYLLYSYTNKYVVLNGHIVTLQDLKRYAEITGDLEALKLFSKGLDELVRTVHKYDTKLKNVGWWSKYSVISFPASQHYHLFNYMLLKWAMENTNNAGHRAILGYYKASWEQSYIKALASTAGVSARTLTSPEDLIIRETDLWGLADFDYKR